MKLLLAVLLWCILFALSWPLAILALVAYPVLWVVSWPLRLVGVTLSALFAFIRGVLYLPARLLGMKSKG